MINATFTNGSFFTELSPDERAGFKPGSWRLVTVPAGTKLFKLNDKGLVNPFNGKVTPWWSPIEPFLDDKKGALATYQDAIDQNMDMSQIVRHLSSVCIDWNELTEFQQIRLNEPAKAFWGTFNPMPKFSNAPWKVFARDGNPDSKATLAKVKKMNSIEKKDGLRKKAKVEGHRDSWQLYIPNLKPENYTESPMIPSYNMASIGIALGYIK